MHKPTQKLIEETKKLIRLQIFLEEEIGLKIDLSSRELKAIMKAFSK